MKLLHLKQFPIFHQLQLEEALLRLSTDDICIMNEGSPPSIVLGISGKPSELVDLEAHKKRPIPLVKRFSGGGTVVVDEETLFVSFLFNKKTLPVTPYPEPILRWTEDLYQRALPIPNLHLRANDYAIGEKKIGGNAQYLRKERWLHHTTFLWDYDKAHMDLLLHPKKTPAYRQGRSHSEFVTRLSSHLPTKELFFDSLKAALSARFSLEEISLGELLPYLAQPHRQSTQRIYL